MKNDRNTVEKNCEPRPHCLCMLDGEPEVIGNINENFEFWRIKK